MIALAFAGKRRPVILVLSLICCYLILAANSVAQTGKPEDAVARLKRVGLYAFGGVGFVGITSRGELDYRAIMAEPPDRALAAFEDIYANGNNQGKSYALAGIHRLNPSRFEELDRTIATSDDVVLTQGGCVRRRRKLSEVAKEIDRRPGDFPWSPSH